jgi:hypothetical protein
MRARPGDHTPVNERRWQFLTDMLAMLVQSDLLGHVNSSPLRVSRTALEWKLATLEPLAVGDTISVSRTAFAVVMRSTATGNGREAERTAPALIAD